MSAADFSSAYATEYWQTALTSLNGQTAVIMNELNTHVSQYQPGAATEIENNLILNWYPRRILRQLEGCEYSSLLELGVGHGYSNLVFGQHFERHVIVEGSDAVIRMFREKNPESEINVVNSYFETFETEERFDTVVMGFVLEHVDDPGVVLSRFRSFLKDAGRMFVAAPNAKSLNRRLGLAMGKLTDIYSLNENDLELGHQRQYCRDTLKLEIESHGFEITWEEGIYLKPLPLRYMQTLPELEANLDAMCQVGVDFPDLCVGLLMEAQIAG